MMMMMVDGDDEVRRSAEMEESPKKWELMNAKIPLFPLRSRQSPNGGIWGRRGGLGKRRANYLIESSMRIGRISGANGSSSKISGTTPVHHRP